MGRQVCEKNLQHWETYTIISPGDSRHKLDLLAVLGVRLTSIFSLLHSVRRYMHSLYNLVPFGRPTLYCLLQYQEPSRLKKSKSRVPHASLHPMRPSQMITDKLLGMRGLDELNELGQSLRRAKL
jgi:hypothetical protein